MEGLLSIDIGRFHKVKIAISMILHLYTEGWNLSNKKHSVFEVSVTEALGIREDIVYVYFIVTLTTFTGTLGHLKSPVKLLNNQEQTN